MLSEPKAKSLTPSLHIPFTMSSDSLKGLFYSSQALLSTPTIPTTVSMHICDPFTQVLPNLPHTHTRTAQPYSSSPKQFLQRTCLNLFFLFFFWNYYFKFHIFFLIKVLFVHFWCSTFFNHYQSINVEFTDNQQKKRRLTQTK